ncbi:MAG: hypothetical protein AB1758_15125 [Candidatus Eremiobacterota bacterium]
MKPALKFAAVVLGLVGFLFAGIQVWFLTFTVSDRAAANKLGRDAVARVEARDHLAADATRNHFIALKASFYGSGDSRTRAWTAFGKFSRQSEGKKIDHAALVKNPTPEFSTALSDFEAGLPELTQLLSSPNILWDSDWSRGPLATAPNYLTLRKIAQNLAGYTDYLRAAGRPSDALRIALLNYHMGGKLGQQGPLIGLMIAAAVHAIGSDTLGALVMSGKLSQDECREVIRQAADHRLRPDLMVERTDEEYAGSMACLDFVQSSPTQANPLLGFSHWMARFPGLLERDRRILQQFYLEDRPYYQSLTDYPQTLTDDHYRTLARSMSPFASALYVNPGRPIENYRMALSRNNALQVLAALQLYRAKEGEYPARLELLAPAFLPELPKDWSSPDGRFHYELKAGEITLASGRDPDQKFYPGYLY